MSDSSLSLRGSRSASKPMRSDMDIYFEAIQNRYHQNNKEGAFPMNVAENHLCWNILSDRLRRGVSENEIPDWVPAYGNPSGTDSFREAVSVFLSKFLFHCEVEKETLAFSSGATSVIELSAFLLANPGDTGVFPAPAYPVYKSDIGTKSGVKRFDLITHHDLSEIRNGLTLSTEHLDTALKDLSDRDEKFKFLVLTTPDNPTGGIYSQEQLNSIVDWCLKHKIHLIVNEIYGLSQIDITHPALKSDYTDPAAFVSFANIMKERKSPYLHLWYAFSKDLGLSGFRVGMVHSYNEEFLSAYNNINMTHSVSNFTQWAMQLVLEDLEFMEDYVLNFQKALTESYVIVTDTLRKIKIPFNPSRGSLFVWMDLSDLLREESEKAEQDLWLSIYQNSGILLTPTDGFGHSQKGLYRMVISSLSHEELKIAMARFESTIVDLRKNETIS